METKKSYPATGTNISEQDAESFRKYTILYIEDNSTIRELVRYIIDLRPNLVYLEAENGKQGLELAQRHHPDLILLDIHLPDMDGFTVFSGLTHTPETSDIPVIALTGSASEIDIQKGLAAGFKKFLPKPIDIKEFYNALDTILEH
jgi:CheY-like chemotaxis protein